MAGKKQLPPVRAVIEGETAPPLSYSNATINGGELEKLRAIERVVAAHIDNENTLARDVASLVRQARDISRRIDELEAEEEVTEVRNGGKAESKFRPEAI